MASLSVVHPCRRSEAIGHEVPTSILPVSDVVVTLLPDTHTVLFIVFGEQLVTLIGSGRMKSLISEVKASAERLFRYALPKLTHSPAWKMPEAWRLIEASPNVNASRLRAELCPDASPSTAASSTPRTPWPERRWSSTG